MEIKMKQSKPSKYKNYYVVTVETMEGDADDEHKMTFEIKHTDDDDLQELKNLLITLEVLKGVEYSKHYHKVIGFEDLISDNLYYSEHFDSYDSIQDYGVYFYDENGTKFSCEIKFDKEDKEKIKKTIHEVLKT